MRLLSLIEVYWVSAFVRSALGFVCLDPEVYEMIQIK